MGVIKRVLTGLTFANAVNIGLSTLFRSLRTRNHKDHKEFEFESLEQCEAAYNQLWDECKPITKPAYDRDKGGIKEGELGSPDQSDAREVYHPPEGRTGKPNAEKGYDYKNHGEDWGKFGQCAGPNQSPVDVSRYVDVQGQTKYLLWFDYYLDPDLQPDHQATIVNDGHGLRFDVPSNNIDMGFVKIGKTEYSAQEYQFHAPSEHTVDGAVFPLELQIYNKAHDGSGIVAIAIFFREGESNPFLASLKESAGGGDGPQWSMAGSGKGEISGHFTGAFDLENVIPAGDVAKEAPFYNYEGSLTQPPCTPGVDWWVLSKPITASRDEIRFIRKAIFMSESTRHGNARESQTLGNRRIFVGLTGFQHAIKGHVSLPGWKDKDEVQRPRGYSSDDLPWGEHWGESGVSGPAAAPAASPK